MSYGRRVKLQVGDLEILYESSDDLRISFDVQRSKSRDPNSAVVQVYNLAPDTRGGFEKAERVFCNLEVGYADESIHNIFAGVLLDIRSVRGDGGFITELTMGDDAEQKSAVNRINKTFKTGTKIGSVLRDLVAATGLKGGNLEKADGEARLAGSVELTRPWTANGQAFAELHAFSRSLGFQWTLQDQKVVFTGLGAGTAGSGPLFKSDNVNESPQFDAQGNISLVGRIVPEMIPGSPFEVQTRGVDARFVATDTRHFGDTSGTDFSIAVTGEPFDRSITKGLVINRA